MIPQANQQERTKRIGVDMFQDPVDDALAKEVQHLLQAQEEIKRKQEATMEMLRCACRGSFAAAWARLRSHGFAPHRCSCLRTGCRPF